MDEREKIFRYAGEMSYIATIYLNDRAAAEGRDPLTNVDRKIGELTKETVKWLIREFNEADRRGEVPRKYKALVSRLMNTLGGTGVTIPMIDGVSDWADMTVLVFYLGVRRELEAREIIKQGILSSELPPGTKTFDVLGIDKRRYDKWKQGSCYCPTRIVKAIYDARPADENYVARLSAILSETETGRWKAGGEA